MAECAEVSGHVPIKLRDQAAVVHTEVTSPTAAGSCSYSTDCSIPKSECSIDAEDYGGTQLLHMEGWPPAIGIFLLSWITTFTVLHS